MEPEASEELPFKHENVTWFFPGPVEVKDLRESEEEKLEKSKVPFFLNPFTFQTGGIMMSYFDVGISMYFLQTPISYYLIETLDISATQYNAYSTLIALPWSLKVFFGLVTDGNPINGYRRKNWLSIGWIIFVAIGFYMSTVESPSFDLITGTTFFMTVGYLFSDVCADSMAVERARHEPLLIKGSFQTSAYTIRSFGCVIGAILGGILYNTPIWG